MSRYSPSEPALLRAGPERTTSRTSNSYAFIHYLRVIAALAVVVTHVSVRYLGNAAPQSSGWWLSTCCDALSRFAAPLFVIISGALLLNPDKNESLGDFYRKRASRVVVPTLVWSAIYLVITGLTDGTRGFEMKHLLWKACTGKPYYHLWFMFVIAGLYVFTPFMRTITRHVTSRQLWLLTILTCVAASVEMLLHTRLESGETTFVRLFVPFVGVYLLGRALTQSPVRVSPAKLVGVVLLTDIVLLVLISGATVAMGKRPAFLTHNLFPLVYAKAAVLFLLCSGVSFPSHCRVSKVCGALAVHSFGIYLMHPAVLLLVPNRVFLGNAWVGIPLITIFAFAVSFLLSTGLKSIPYARELV